MTPIPENWSAEVQYVVLLFALFVLPKAVDLLSTFGIVSLFLFAGLESTRRSFVGSPGS